MEIYYVVNKKYTTSTTPRCSTGFLWHIRVAVVFRNIKSDRKMTASVLKSITWHLSGI